jgi:predicted DNA binding CopG/RHH family protein
LYLEDEVSYNSLNQKQIVNYVFEDLRKKKAPNNSAPKKQKFVNISRVETKVQDVTNKATCASLPYSADVSEIMKVMIEPIPFALLSPLRSDLTSLLQSKETALAARGNVGGGGGGRRNGTC